MTVHLSARLTWHDGGWNGRVCSNPLANTSCLVHDHIRDARDDAQELAHAGQALDEISYRPPCSRDPGAYSDTGYVTTHRDPLDFRKLPSVDEELRPYTIATSPYGRMFGEAGGWEYDPDKQLARLDEFFGAFEPKKSLVFYYLKDGQPFLDTSQRIVVGIGRIKRIGSQLNFGRGPAPYDRDYPIWSRAITQDFPEQGIRLPLQEYAAADRDVSDILVTVPDHLTASFSYVAEHVSDDSAIAVIERVLDAVRQVKADAFVAGNWEHAAAWLEGVLGEAWADRGAYPGIPAMLHFLGCNSSVTFHRDVVMARERAGEDALQVVLDHLEGRAVAPPPHVSALLTAAGQWKREPEARRNLLTLLARMSLTPAQLERVVHPVKRAEAGIDLDEDGLVANPYAIAELDRGAEESDPIGFSQIDHALLPAPAALTWVEPIAADDDRRVRALLVDSLKVAAGEGDTLLPLEDACQRVTRSMSADRKVIPDPVRLQAASDFFEERLRYLDHGGRRYVALRTLAEDEAEVGARLSRMATKTHDVGAPEWPRLLADVLRGVPPSPDEEAARAEKAKALDLAFHARLSVITGKAGTGKTTVVRALLDGIQDVEGNKGVLLLAPTGKARIRLQESTKRDAKTIHQFLAELGWIEFGTFALKRAGGRTDAAETVVIDEASMIPVDLMAALFRAIDFNKVQRLVLMGDPNQLPPIGPGRPFADLIAWLESDRERARRLVRLELRGRFRDARSLGLALSDGYTTGQAPADDDEPLSRVARDDLEGEDVLVSYWDGFADLHAKLDSALRDTVIGGGDGYAALDASFNNAGSRSAERWQILSPLRRLPIGTDELNRRIQLSYRRSTIEVSKKRQWLGKRQLARPAGDHQIVLGDKVIQIRNHRRRGWHMIDREEHQRFVANGEVGLVTWSEHSKSGDSLSVEFGTQPAYRFRYWRNQVDENLDLAYAITVHKSQGSDFETVFLVLPQSAATMSRELLYTALTRFRSRLVLLLEKDTKPLERYRSPETSETLRRNTNLFGLAVRPEGVGVPYPERLIHRTTSGVLVRSKSEVIVADVLTSLGISFEYERRLEARNDRSDFRLPDFTVHYEGDTWYWEHLGMLSTPSYAEGWARKQKWYEDNGLLGQVLTSEDGPDGSIDAAEIEATARRRILQEG